jgi:uncharacterized phosphosugar-binding protein
MSAQAYLQRAAEAVRALDVAGIERAAAVLADRIAAGKSVFAFGASHSFMPVEEMVYRTGGLMLINPIYPHGMNLGVTPLPMTSQLERVVGLGTTLLANSPAKAGDVLILVSTSGRNAVTIDMALLARERQLTTIAITARAYSDGVTSRHPSGKKLAELCDLVIDNGAPFGDAVVEVPGFAHKVGPLSSVTGCAIVNALACETVKLLVPRGLTPPVFVSANTDPGDAHNARLLRENRDRIHYL